MSGVQGHLSFIREMEASLGYVRPYLKALKISSTTKHTNTAAAISEYYELSQL